MNVYGIFDPRRDDQDAMIHHWQERQVPYFYAIAGFIDKGDTITNINLSHKFLVRHAKRHDLEEVCILEADAFFPAIDGWQYYMENKPAEYDLYLGGCYSELTGILTAEPAYVTTDSPAGLHCYCIHSRYYDQFLSVPDDVHIDTAQTGGLYKVCYPFACIQRSGSWSANHKKDVDYNVILREKGIAVRGWP